MTIMANNDNRARLDDDREEHLKQLYYDAGGQVGFASVQRLYDYVRREGRYHYSRKDVRNFLLKQDVYTGHVVKKKAKHFYNVVVPRSNHTIDMDTAYFDFDTPYKYFLLGIDIFTRKAAARPLRDMKANSSRKAIDEIIREIGGTVNVRHDRGSEFKNRIVTNYFRRENINDYDSFAPYKSNYVERLIRTLKRKLYAIMQSKGTREWQRYLPEAIKSYNSTIHSSTGKAPANVRERDESDIWFRTKHKNFAKAPVPKAYKFKLNDAVKINSIRENFAKEFYENNSPRIYYISQRSSNAGIQRYKLKDERNRSLPGSYSNNQLQLVTVNEETRYRIEKILQRKRINNVPHALVKWFGYPNEFNSYVPVSEIGNLR